MTPTVPALTDNSLPPIQAQCDERTTREISRDVGVNQHPYS